MYARAQRRRRRERSSTTLDPYSTHCRTKSRGVTVPLEFLGAFTASQVFDWQDGVATVAWAFAMTRSPWYSPLMGGCTCRYIGRNLSRCVRRMDAGVRAYLLSKVEQSVHAIRKIAGDVDAGMLNAITCYDAYMRLKCYYLVKMPPIYH